MIFSLRCQMCWIYYYVSLTYLLDYSLGWLAFSDFSCIYRMDLMMLGMSCSNLANYILPCDVSTTMILSKKLLCSLKFVTSFHPICRSLYFALMLMPWLMIVRVAYLFEGSSTQ